MRKVSGRAFFFCLLYVSLLHFNSVMKMIMLRTISAAKSLPMPVVQYRRKVLSRFSVNTKPPYRNHGRLMRINMIMVSTCHSPFGFLSGLPLIRQRSLRRIMALQGCTSRYSNHSATWEYSFSTLYFM